jgi:hypothetical protein
MSITKPDRFNLSLGCCLLVCFIFFLTGEWTLAKMFYYTTSNGDLTIFSD